MIELLSTPAAVSALHLATRASCSSSLLQIRGGTSTTLFGALDLESRPRVWHDVRYADFLTMSWTIQIQGDRLRLKAELNNFTQGLVHRYDFVVHTPTCSEGEFEIKIARGNMINLRALILHQYFFCISYTRNCSQTLY